MAKIRYEIEVEEEMFPFAPGSEVVVRNSAQSVWCEDVFLMLNRYAHPPVFVCKSRVRAECHSLATHGHLIGTTYPADTPACAKCGKAAPEWKYFMGEKVCEACLHATVAPNPTSQAQPGKFQPFQQVLVRDSDSEKWQIDLFSRIGPNDYYACLGGYFEQCIPWVGNEHLLGTDKNFVNS